MRFFFDNNLSYRLVDGLKAFGEDVVHLTEYFSADEKDTVWLEYIGQNGWVLITRDEKIRWNPAELAAFRRNRVGAFFLGGKNKSGWDLIQQIIRVWPTINDYAEHTNKPYAFRIPPNGTKFTKMDLS
jgi:predicted nuclease of predicted toxin-antitoxin system